MTNYTDPMHDAVLAEMKRLDCVPSTREKFNGGNPVVVTECVEHCGPWDFEKDECGLIRELMLAGWKAGAKFTRRGVVNQILGMLADMSLSKKAAIDFSDAYEAINDAFGEKND